MTDNSDHESAGEDSESTSIAKVDVAIGRPIPGENLYRFSITDALKHIGFTGEDAAESSLLLRPEKGEKQELVAHVISGELAQGGRGRTDSKWRTIRAPESSSTYRITLRADQLEPLGFDLDESLPIVNIWAGDDLLVFERVDEKQIAHPQRAKVKQAMENHDLSHREASYAVKHGIDPSELSDAKKLVE